MLNQDDLYTFMISLYEEAKVKLAREGGLMKSHTLLTLDGKKVFILESDGLDKNEVPRALKEVAPACKAMGSTCEAWMAPEKASGVRPTDNPNRVEAIVVSVQSKEGSYLLCAKFDRDADANPSPPSSPVVSWNGEVVEGSYANLFP